MSEIVGLPAMGFERAPTWSEALELRAPAHSASPAHVTFVLPDGSAPPR